MLARNDGRVVLVIPAKAGIQKVWVGHFVSEQSSEAIFTKKEIASSPEFTLSPVEGTSRNDRTLHLLMKSGSD